MKVVALVPIKLNNQRLPGKNLKSFSNGEPLMTYALRTLLTCKNIDEVYVYCSSEEVKPFLPNGVKYLKRSKNLDSTTTTANDILDAFCNEVVADVYVMSHVTSPFIKSSSIDNGIEAVIFEGYDSAFSARKIQDFIWLDGKPLNYELNRIPRTQDLKPYYIETCAFYVFTRMVFSKNKTRIGNNPKLIEVDEIESFDIDEPIDFEIADMVFNYLKNKNR